MSKANRLCQESEYDQAIAIYTRIIKSNKKLQRAWYERGLAYQATRKYDLAMADFNKTMALKTHKGLVVELNRDSPFADEVAKMQVEYGDPFFQRAQVKFYVDSLESSFADFQALLNMGYKKASCLLWQGAIYVKKGEHAAACPLFIQAKKLAATPVEVQQSNEATSTYCGQ